MYSIKNIFRFFLIKDKQNEDLINEIKELKEKVEVLSSKINELSDELNTIKSSTDIDATPSDEGPSDEKLPQTESDEYLQFKQEKNIKRSKDYEIAVQQFMYLNEQISRAFKKNDELRYFFYDMISGGNISINMLKTKIESLNITEEDFDNYLNLAEEIRSFIDRQSNCILQFNRETLNNDNLLFADLLIYPKEGDTYDADLHDNMYEDDGHTIGKICQLGCKFECFFTKAVVKLN